MRPINELRPRKRDYCGKFANGCLLEISTRFNALPVLKMKIIANTGSTHNVKATTRNALLMVPRKNVILITCTNP
jgi:hypothetical protein